MERQLHHDAHELPLDPAKRDHRRCAWRNPPSKECEAEASRRKIPFQKFSLQDGRPKGVTDKLSRGDTDTMDDTMHSSERMVRQVYDRRRVRVAKPAG